MKLDFGIVQKLMKIQENRLLLISFRAFVWMLAFLKFKNIRFCKWEWHANRWNTHFNRMADAIIKCGVLVTIVKKYSGGEILC